MPFNDIYRLRLYGRLHGAQIVNVLHFVQDDPLPTQGAQQLANDFVTNMRATLIARVTTAFTYEYVEVESIVPYAGGPFVAAFPGGTVGTRTGICASATLAEVISIYTSRGGRRGKGRMYLCGGNTDQSTGITNGAWASPQTGTTQAYATALATRYMAVLTGSVGLWRLGVWSKASGPPLPPWTSDQFVRATSLTVRTTVRNQRRRQIGVGR